MHKLLSRIRGAIFDLDGTLIDSMGVWEQVDIDFLARYGIACDASYTRAVGSMHYEEAARYTIERYGLQLTEQQVLDMWMDMAIQAYGNTIELKPHAPRAARKLPGTRHPHRAGHGLARRAVRAGAQTARATGLV